MAGNALKQVAKWNAAEMAWEGGLPLLAAGTSWYLAHGLWAAPTPARPWSPLEWLVVAGACAGISGWAISRQLSIFGRRRLRTLLLWSMLSVGGGTLGLPMLVRNSFAEGCAAPLLGTLVEAQPLHGGEPGSVCSVGAVVGNPFLPGTLVRPSWDAEMHPLEWVWLVLCAGLGALGLRDVRLFRTSIPQQAWEFLRIAPSAGPASAIGGLPKDGKVVACGNATLWGEPCGQLYSAEHAFEPGEWCARCQQVFHRAERELTFHVVTLFSADIDVLNGLERLDTTSWPRGGTMPPDARISGQERWVAVGNVTLPDVITVAQALALVHHQLPRFSTNGDQRVKSAVELAKKRASQVCAWIWFGRHAQRLTYARPTPHALFAFGAMRLRDLVHDVGDELTLQLDVGLLPVEVRSAFKRTFLAGRRSAEFQNSKVDIWVPVGPQGTEGGTAWVDRIGGDGLRSWLATERARDDEAQGVSTPLPYLPAAPPDADGSIGEPPADDGRKPGRLDLILVSPAVEGLDIGTDVSPGASIAEWEWLDWEQIQLLRQRSLVLVEAGRRST